LKQFWMSWALRRADRVIAVSDGLRRLAIDLGVDPRRVRTVPNGINDDVFYRRDRLGCRARLGMAPGERIILSAGDLAELKGHHRIIAAVKSLNDRGVPARLLIAGGVGRSGRYAETLHRQVAAAGLADRVTFLGEVTQDALAELMSAADVFCLASSTEGWPNVVNEALACGTPVVATDVGAVPQMVVSDQYGFVVPVHDATALAEALGTALTGRWDHEAIAAWGRSRSWSQVAEDVLDQMRAAMAGAAAPSRRAGRVRTIGLRDRTVVMAGIAVIVNADDLGMSREVNDAIFELMSRGRISSATILANAPATRDAARRAQAFPRCSFGVHLNLTQFEPLTGGPGRGCSSTHAGR
jgi:hypothetical protein